MTKPLRLPRDLKTQTLKPFDDSFKSLAVLVPDALIIFDTEMKVVYLNSAAEEMFGYEVLEAVGKRLDIFLPDDSIKSHQFYVSDFLNKESGARRMAEGRLVHGKHRDGHLIPLNIVLTRRKLQDDVFVFCVLRDMSTQIDARQDLHESEERYRGMIDSQNTLVVRVDRQGNFVFANQAYCKMFGKSLEELIGHSFAPLVHPDDIAPTLEAMKGLERPPYRIYVEQRAMTIKGWRHIAWEDSIITDPIRDHYEIQGVGYDITERKQAEEIAIAERDLAIILAQKSTLDEALPLCLDLALKISGMDCGGIYLLEPHSQDLVLATHKGLSPEFVERTTRFHPGTPRYQTVMNGSIIYTPFIQTIKESGREPDSEDALRSFIGIPLRSKESVIACINIASHSLDEMSSFNRVALENFAVHIGNTISRFQSQEALVESQKQFQSMFDSLQDYVFVLDEQANIVQVNQKVLEGLGYLRDELIGKSVLEVHPMEQRAHAAQIVQDMLAGVVETCPLNLLRKDGSQLPVETKVARGRWGETHALIGISRDITERKAAEKLIQEKAIEIEGFFNVSLDFLCIVDVSTSIFLRVNKAWENLGYSPDDLLDKKYLDFLHPDDVQAARVEVRQLTKKNQTLNYINRFRPKEGGWRYLEWRAQIQGNSVYAAARDITERMAAEEARIQQTKLLEYRQKFEEILTFISTRFINISLDDVNTEITHVLKQIGEFEHADRSYVFLIDTEKDSVSNTHEWCADGIEPQIDTLQDIPSNFLPWWMDKLKKFEDIHIPVVSELPPEAQAEREILESQSIQSVLVVPLVSHNTLLGFLGFDSVVTQRYWSSDSILLIKMVGDILSNAFGRKQMQTELQTERDFALQVMNAMGQGLTVTGQDGSFDFVNPAYANIIGYSALELVGRMPHDVTSVVDHDTLAEQRRRRYSGEVTSYETYLKRRDGSETPVLITGSPRIREGKVVGTVAVITDLAERIKMENDLRQSEARHRALLSAIPDLIFRIRRDGTFLDFNANSNDLLSLPREQIVGSSITNVFHGSLAEKVMPCIENALRSGEIQTIEYTLKLGDSTHVFEARFKDSGVDEVTAIVRDVSDRARLEQMKSDFINRATHELRTPIATMLLMANLIDSRTTPEEYKEYWGVLKSELGRERILIEDLLSAGRLESDQFRLHFSSFNMIEVITRVVHQLESPADDKNVKIRLQTQPEAEAVIMADEKALTQVFMNLLGNAIKFSRPDTEVDIYLKRTEKGFEISISDSGIGIPSEDLPLLFTRFFRGSNAIENEIQGTGIGLFIVQSILEKHNGKIKVRSELGKGTQFDIWLPATQE